MAAAAEQNPSVLLSKERIEAAQGEVTTQLGALLPNLSANVRQSQQTQFLGTFGLAPVRTEPFSIFDARVSASQSSFSAALRGCHRARVEGDTVPFCLEGDGTRELLAVAQLAATDDRASAQGASMNAGVQGSRDKGGGAPVR